MLGEELFSLNASVSFQAPNDKNQTSAGQSRLLKEILDFLDTIPNSGTTEVNMKHQFLSLFLLLLFFVCRNLDGSCHKSALPSYFCNMFFISCTCQIISKISADLTC